MKNADWREYRRLQDRGRRQEGCTMSDKMQAPSQAVPSQTTPGVQEWLADLGEATRQYGSCYAEMKKHQEEARHEQQQADQWRNAAEEKLEAVRVLLGERWGRAFTAGLAKLEAEAAEDEANGSALDDEDLDAVYETTDAEDSGIDLSRPDVEERPDVD